MTISPNKINKIIELHNIGFSVRKIEKEVRISKTTVQKYISKFHNNEVSQMIIFPEKNYYMMAPPPVPHQQRQVFIQPQEPYGSYFLEYPLFLKQYPGELLEEYIIREREKEKEEQRKKLYQEEQEKSHQSIMKSISEEENRKRKENKENLAFLDKIIQDNRKFYKEMNKNKLESDKKSQEKQLFIKSPPVIVREEMTKAPLLKQAPKNVIQRDNDQNHKPMFTILKPAGEELNTESNYSDVLGDVILAVLPVISNIIKFYQSPDSNIPLNSPEHWYRFSKYMKNDMKHET